MPSNWLYVDTNFPTFAGEESPNEKISTIQNYMYMLLEQLRYTLHNLDTSNMNQTALTQFENYLTEPIYTRIQDDEGNIQQLSITAQRLLSRMSDAEGNISAIEQYAKSITLAVTNGETSSTIQLLANGIAIASQIVTFNGVVTFEGLRSGRTVIDGGWINTENLNLTGCITWSDFASALKTRIQNMVPDLPEYIHNTYIDSTEIRSPTIKANDFSVYPRSRTSQGSFNLYGDFGSGQTHALQIYYYDGRSAPYIHFDSPSGCYAYWDFPVTNFTGRIVFEGDVDFSRANVTGLNEE